VTYQDFTFASRNGFTLADGGNSITNIAQNYYGTVSVTNTVTMNLPASVALQFDANGNLTNDGTKSLSYDAENQLTNVQVAGQWREDFLYDGLNRRRITRQYAWSAGVWALTNETRFIYDGNLVIQERDGNNQPLVTYTRGWDLSRSAGLSGGLQGAGGIGGLLARQSTINSQLSTTFYHADGNGNVTALMDTNQYMVARYLYDPFGKLLGKWGKLADANVYRFSSKEWDANAGLYYYLYRFYEPDLQRWVNRDPIQERGGINLYLFCNNNSLCYADTDGRFVQALPKIVLPVAKTASPLILSCPVCDAAMLGAGIGSAASRLPVIGGGTVADYWGDVIYDTFYHDPKASAGGATGTHPSSPLPGGSNDPLQLPRTNPGRDCGGNCKPCPPNSPAWEVNEPGHGSPTTHWHWIEYHQDPKTCECYPRRMSSPIKPPGA
jgi:RHS repeat-associated protein